MIGGFLGAGKTTAVGKLARWLASKRIRAGLITNDQGCNLVDTALLRSQGFATEEIPGGCFCCRFNSLVDASQRLANIGQPEVLIAEPVGSCTDLTATVAFPLRRLYGDNFTLAPVSVLVDPVRALRVFGLEKAENFSEKILYIYLKQIEESDLVVISKCDLLDEARLESLQRAITAKFPRKEILAVSVRNGTNLELWFSRITTTEQTAQTAMKVDYEIYADGEALLGWLNCTVQIKARQAFEADVFLTELAAAVQKHLRKSEAQIAHLKMTLSPDPRLADEIAAVNLVHNDFVPEFSFHLTKPVTNGQLIINLRAEAAPDVLGAAVREGLATVEKKFPAMEATLDNLQHFRPGKPSPTHRMSALTA